MAFYQQRQQQKSKRKLWACNICNVVWWRVFSWVGILPLFQCTQWVEILYKVTFQVSMTSLLMHTIAHLTRPTYRPKVNNLPIKKFLSRAASWVKIVKNGKILTFKVNFLCQKLSESFKFFYWRIWF